MLLLMILIFHAAQPDFKVRRHQPPCSADLCLPKVARAMRPQMIESRAVRRWRHDTRVGLAPVYVATPWLPFRFGRLFYEVAFRHYRFH